MLLEACDVTSNGCHFDFYQELEKRLKPQEKKKKKKPEKKPRRSAVSDDDGRVYEAG